MGSHSGGHSLGRHCRNDRPCAAASRPADQAAPRDAYLRERIELMDRVLAVLDGLEPRLRRTVSSGAKLADRVKRKANMLLDSIDRPAE